MLDVLWAMCFYHISLHCNKSTVGEILQPPLPRLADFVAKVGCCRRVVGHFAKSERL
jgi:hypothetical protein